MVTLPDRVRAHVLADFATADPAHDIHHLDRVAALAGDIAVLLGADPQTAQVAAYVHDYHRVEEARQGRRPIRPEEARSAVLDVLERSEVPEKLHGTILRAVELTGRYRFGGDELDGEDLIAAAVHDADNLDAMGAVGVGRAFAFGGLLGEPLWEPAAGLKELYTEGETSSVLAHLYEKLVHLEKDMLTEPARRLAAERAFQLHRFAAEFRSQWGEEDVVSHSGGTRVHWDPLTRFLAVTQPEPDGITVTHIGFRGQAMLAFDEQGQPVGVDLLGAPEALTHCVPHAQRSRAWVADAAGGWLLDAEADVVWISISEAPVRRRLTAVGDIEVQLREGKLATLRMHLTEEAPVSVGGEGAP
uniref:Metal dependent phosphohydrolase n=1 Tax=Streptomyces antibioticus TaxID=1890 RepID=A0A1S5NPU2_STRAT|nr:metal dependent phosphohydrolase [Streptomyces antibioticus]